MIPLYPCIKLYIPSYPLIICIYIIIYIYPANQRPRKTWSFQWTSFTCKRTYFTWVNFCQSSVDAVDKFVYRQITANPSLNWLSSRALGINYIVLLSPFTAAHSPWRVRQQPKTSRETPVSHPWTTREPPVNHPWYIREPFVRRVC